MQFKLSTAVLTSLIGVALSGPLVVRDTATILSDLSTIDSDINSLTQQFNEFTGDLSQALATQVIEQQLESDINKATSDTQATSALSAADSTSVTNALLGLKPDIITSLDAIVAKVPSLLFPNRNSILYGLRLRLLCRKPKSTRPAWAVSSSRTCSPCRPRRTASRLPSRPLPLRLTSRLLPLVRPILMLRLPAPLLSSLLDH